MGQEKEPDVNLNEVMELENNENVTNEVGDPNDSDSMMEKEPELQKVGEEHERELQKEEEVVEVDVMMDKEDVVMEGVQLGNAEFLEKHSQNKKMAINVFLSKSDNEDEEDDVSIFGKEENRNEYETENEEPVSKKRKQNEYLKKKS